MNKQPSRIGLYLVLIIALVAGYFYLNNQVVSQSNYTQKQLEQALEDNKVVDAAIQQNREVPTGSVIVAGYLLDGADGRTLAVESRMNPQAQYGADVIMRANYALEHGTEALSMCVRKAVNEMLGSLAEDAGIRREDVFQVCVVGNTCMHHLFLGISPASLVHAPYTPAIRQSLVLRASDYGLHVHPKAQLLLLPDIAGYVGWLCRSVQS